MANAEQLTLLKTSVAAWNKWRGDKPDKEIDLSKARLSRADLHGVDLRDADLRGAHLDRANLAGAKLSKAKLSEANLCEADLQRANLRTANLSRADLLATNFRGANLRDADIFQSRPMRANFTESDLRGADLRNSNLFQADFSVANLSKATLADSNLTAAHLKQANLTNANLSDANLSHADLSGANLYQANLTEARLNGANLRGTNLIDANLSGASLLTADLSGADLSGADLTFSNLVSANISSAKISKSKVYGTSVWDLRGQFKEQKDLIITSRFQSSITIDNIKVAQFVYLILNNEEIREVINTLTSKTVLILGRFAIPERKAILNALREKLREYDLLPIVFDFDRPTDKDFTETIKTLAGLCYFVIADVTNPKSSPLELQATVPDYQIPFVPIIQEGEYPFAMMVDLQKKYPWVLDTISYDSPETLIKALKPAIIDPAIQKHNELRLIKAREPKILSATDFIDDKA